MSKDQAQPLHVVRLTVESFKRISALSLDPVDGEPVIISGDNGAGKSSVLDAVYFALTGKGATEPLRKGDERGVINLTLGGRDQSLEVRRSFTNDSKHLVVRDPEGGQLPRAQELLNGLIGALAFDPEEFVRMKDKERARALQVAAGLDLDDLDARRKAAYDARTVANRALKEADAALKDLGPAMKDPGEGKSAREISEKLNARKGAVADLRDVKSQKDRLEEEAEALRKTIARLQEELKEFEGKIADCRDKIDKLAPLAERAEKEIPDLEAEFDSIDEHNRQVAEFQKDDARRTAAREQRDRAVEKVRACEKTLKEVDKEKDDLLASSPLPAGVEFTEDGEVRVDGLPFSDLNTARKWELACYLAGMQDPPLRVVFIREGALMNRETKAHVFQWAAEKGIQVWVEEFREEPGDEGIFIEEGKVTHRNGKEVGS